MYFAKPAAEVMDGLAAFGGQKPQLRVLDRAARRRIVRLIEREIIPLRLRTFRVHEPDDLDSLFHRRPDPEDNAVQGGKIIGERALLLRRVVDEDALVQHQPILVLVRPILRFAQDVGLETGPVVSAPGVHVFEQMLRTVAQHALRIAVPHRLQRRRRQSSDQPEEIELLVRFLVTHLLERNGERTLAQA